MQGRGVFVATIACVLVCGCAAPPTNPSVDVDAGTAWDTIERIRTDPIRLPRPLVLLGGWADPGLATSRIEKQLRRAFDDDRIIAVGFAFDRSFDACRLKVIETVDQAFATDDPVWTEPVDVIAASMGGLVARYAAAPPAELGSDPSAPPAGFRRLRMLRLFTIATPHPGADLARVAIGNRLARDMRPGSAFLASFDEAFSTRDYEVVPYVRLSDTIVGARNAAPPGQLPHWVGPDRFGLGHLDVVRDPRILADIMLRLRDEQSFAIEPRTPLPEP